MSRKSRIISGIAYPNVYVGEEQPQRIEASFENGDHYYDDAARLTKQDLQGFKGKPICLEHDLNAEIGVITSAWEDSDHHMRITAHIWTDTPDGEAQFERINRGDLRGLSVNYRLVAHPSDPRRVMGKVFDEVSVCETPFFEGAAIRVAASSGTLEKSAYKMNSPHSIQFKIMASEVKNSAGEAPLTEGNKDASELAKIHDEVLRKAEEMERKLKEMEEANRRQAELLAQHDAQREKERQAYAESQKPILAETLETNLLQMREEHGDAATLPEDYVVSTTAAFLAPEAAQAIAPIVASARAWRKQRDARIAQEARMSEMEEKLKKMTEDQSIAMAHVTASRNRLNLATSPAPSMEIPVTASGEKKLTMSNLFIPKQASEEERMLLQQNYGRAAPDISVTASATSALPPAPPALSKQLADSVPNSMSRKHPIMFNHIVANSRGFARIPGRNVVMESKVLDH